MGDLDKPESMTQEEAQERCDALEELLSDEQKDTLALFELPRGRGGPPGGGPGGGAPGMGGAPGGMGAGGGGAADESNPFQEEANQSRLRSLLGRLQSSPAAQEATLPSDSGAGS